MLIPAAAGMWMGLIGAASAVGATVTGYHLLRVFGDSAMWLDLVTLPLLVAVVLGSVVHRRSRSRLLVLLAFALVALLGSVWEIRHAGDHITFGVAVVSSMIVSVLAVAWLVRTSRTEAT